MFHIGDNIFVYATTFRGEVFVHIRRLKKYGESFYPTKEGVTLQPIWIEYLMRPECIPKCAQDLKDKGNSILMPEREIKIDSTDFENFTFTRFKTLKNGDTVTKQIAITNQQWSEMTRNYNDIASSVLNHVYGSMDFLSAYTQLHEGIIEESLPDSFDVSVGTQCLVELLKDSLYDCLKEHGCLKEPRVLAEELWANRVETFDSLAFAVEVCDIAGKFHGRVWEKRDFLTLSLPALYITKTFLSEIRLADLLRDLRLKLCPPDAFAYFEDANFNKWNFFKEM